MNDQPYLYDAYPRPSANEVAKFESQYSLRFPPPYREFILSANGGIYTREAVVFSKKGSKFDIQSLDSFSDDPSFHEGRSLQANWHYNRHDMPKDFFPVGFGEHGMSFCINLKEPGVWFREPHEADTWKTLDSFEDLLSGVVYDPDMEYEQTETGFVEIERGAITAFSQLIRNGVNTGVKNIDGDTLLTYAADVGQPRCLDLLLEVNDIEIDAVNDEGRTALNCASSSFDMTRALLEAGADVNLPDEDGTTPLMSAARMGNARSVDLLVKAGANVHAVDHAGRSVRDYLEHTINPMRTRINWLIEKSQ